MTSPFRDFARVLLGAATLVVSVETSAQAGGCADAARCCSTPSAPTATSGSAFGIHIWPASLATAPQAVDKLIALRPRHLRFALGPNWARRPPLNNAMTDDQLDAFVNAGFADSQLAVEIDALRLLRNRTGAALHLVIWAPPPLPSEFETSPNRSRTLRRADIAIAARFHIALLKYLSARGFAADAVELSNEPDGDWNIRITPENYLALLGAVRSEANRRGVTLPSIYGPGTSSVAATRAFLADPRIARGILGAVDTLSIHGWDNPAQRDRIVEFEALIGDLKHFSKVPTIALTEYGLARPDPADASDRANIKTRAPDTVANTQPYAIMAARDMLRFYGAGAGTIIYWEFQDQSWGRASFGLLDEKGAERPIFNVMASISRQLSEHGASAVRPLDASDLFAIRRGNDDVLASINAGDQPKTILFGDHTRGPRTIDCRDQRGHSELLAQPWSLTFAPIERH